MAEQSAGVLIWRRGERRVEVLLVHPGGPFWRGKDKGAWQIPKGAPEAGEDAEAAARREVQEELGVVIDGPLVPLGRIRQAGGKRVDAFAWEGEVDAGAITSVTFEMEWPPRSGRVQAFPEVDAARWFTLAEAREMMLASQIPLLDPLADQGAIGSFSINART